MNVWYFSYILGLPPLEESEVNKAMHLNRLIAYGYVKILLE